MALKFTTTRAPSEARSSTQTVPEASACTLSTVSTAPEASTADGATTDTATGTPMDSPDEAALASEAPRAAAGALAPSRASDNTRVKVRTLRVFIMLLLGKTGTVRCGIAGQAAQRPASQASRWVLASVKADEIR